MDIFEKCNKHSLAHDLEAMDFYPYFHPLESRPDAEVFMEGKRRIMLGSNNYLGLTANEEVIEAGVKALEKLGTGCSGSRFLNGTLDLHLELEGELADFLHKEAVLTFSTGFQSNLGIISAIVGKNDYAIIDRESHASIYDACRLSLGTMLRYRHSDMHDLERQLQKVPENKGILIITDGVFSMGGDIAKLPEICDLAEKYGARVMVDDAHGLGVLGEGGRGTANYYCLEDRVDIYMGTFSKSLASLGGYLACSENVAYYIRHASRPFMFSASIPPSNCAVALAALRYLRKNPEIVTNLSRLGNYFRKALTDRDVKLIEAFTPIVPIYTYEPIPTLKKVKKIYDRGVFTNSVLPPACSPGECLIRTSLMATLNKALLEEAADIIAEVIHENEDPDE